MTASEVRPVPATAPDFPRVHARTQGFSLGIPRHLTVGAERVVFLRGEGDHPSQSLWCDDGAGERLLADPEALVPAELAAELPPEERARRERARERASGIVAYATDDDLRHVVFTLAGKLLVTDADTGETVQLAVDGPIVDPRPDPTGQRVAYVQDEALWTVRTDGTNAPRQLVADRDPHVSWGLAEFVAGEEMGRTRGFWWAPDGRRLLAARVDTSPVRRWWIAAPVDPDAAPAPIAYPAAGTPNAEVTLALVDLDGATVPVDWDHDAYPYLAEVVWTSAGPQAPPDGPAGRPVLVVQSRDQRTLLHLSVDPVTGVTSPVATDQAEPWIELIPGSPTWTPDGRLVRAVHAGDVRGVAVGEDVLADPRLTVASVVGADDTGVVVTAHVRERPWCTVVARLVRDEDGGTATTIISDPDGAASATMGGSPPRLAITQRRLDSHTTTVALLPHHRGGPSGRDDDRIVPAGGDAGAVLASRALTPPPLPVRVVGPVGGGDTPVSLLLHPDGWTSADGPLPVLVDSYGGPHARRVVAAGTAHLTAAWFAANGFAVLVTDGPGAPGQSLTWEAMIAGDPAGPTLEGQVEALQRAADAHPGLLDLDRVAIRGWSFGGYLAALGVLRRPDVFHAAVSGAPVTDWALYDTHYTERYLGPDVAAEPYRQASIIADAPALRRPLLLLHGLADDNVVAAHTLRLSRALLEAGRPHEVLPLSGVTHFTPSEEVNTNLLLLQLDFLRRALTLS